MAFILWEHPHPCYDHQRPVRFLCDDGGDKYLNPFVGRCGVDVAVLDWDSFVLWVVRDPG